MKISAQQARDTKVFVIENSQIIETTLFDHVAESAEETTSPRGVMHKMFKEEVSGAIYRLIAADRIIDEIEYDALSEDDQENYEYIGETTIRWQLREWMLNGKSRLIETYETEDRVNDEWFDRTYNSDFLPDDQRDTRYWYTREDAETALDEMLKEQ